MKKKWAIGPGDRGKVLLERRRRKMAESLHAYVRGNTTKFYEWLESTGASNLIPQGPPVWICGDCHLGNLGPIANTDGDVEIQIRDLDQAVIGNPTHDLIRLSLSLAMAARSSDLPGVTTAVMIERIIEAYRSGLLHWKMEHTRSDIEPVRGLMKEALHRKWRQLARESIEDPSPRIPLGKRFWVLTKTERDEIERVVAEEKTRKLITCLKFRSDEAPIQLLDAAYWLKGCSSLGRLRCAVLVGIGRQARDGMCLLDIKESCTAAAPKASTNSMPTNNAERIVSGARALSPFLGERMLAGRFLDKSVIMRELMPQDLKFEMQGFTQDKAVGIASLFASVIGRAHGRQMDTKNRKVWARELNRRHSKSLDAPSWLWRSVVELASIHEAAYLDHCRSYALEAKTSLKKE
jgi:uncharacterized protein (DUF2252 family)